MKTEKRERERERPKTKLREEQYSRSIRPVDLDHAAGVTDEWE